MSDLVKREKFSLKSSCQHPLLLLHFNHHPCAHTYIGTWLELRHLRSEVTRPGLTSICPAQSRDIRLLVFLKEAETLPWCACAHARVCACVCVPTWCAKGMNKRKRGTWQDYILDSCADGTKCLPSIFTLRQIVLGRTLHYLRPVVKRCLFTHAGVVTYLNYQNLAGQTTDNCR